jgi:drug/metabolite transporter (DMT)-like permease
MSEEIIGQFAALGTAILFAFGSTLFTLSGRLVGSTLVNRTRLLIAVIVVMLLHTLMFGQPLPLDAGDDRWLWLGFSGLVGLAIGDALLFQAFVMIGPRLAMLVMALAPVLGVVMAWVFLGEVLTVQELAGIGLTVAGIGVVVSERQGRQKSTSLNVDTSQQYIIGLLFAFGGALGQAGGQVLAKPGLSDAFSPWSALVIRLLIALIAIWGISILRGEVMKSYRTLRAQPRALGMMSIAAVTGPVIGVWLSLVAVQRAPVGVSSALIAMTPVFLIPISYLVFKERPTVQAVLGTLVAFGGTVLLFI